MINKIPGWLNMVLLWHIYFIVGLLVYGVLAVTKMVPWLWWVVGFEWIMSAIHAGLYLAKWRFDKDGWRFW